MRPPVAIVGKLRRNGACRALSNCDLRPRRSVDHRGCYAKSLVTTRAVVGCESYPISSQNPRAGAIGYALTVGRPRARAIRSTAVTNCRPIPLNRRGSATLTVSTHIWPLWGSARHFRCVTSQDPNDARVETYSTRRPAGNGSTMTLSQSSYRQKVSRRTDLATTWAFLSYTADFPRQASGNASHRQLYIRIRSRRARRSARRRTRRLRSLGFS